MRKISKVVVTAIVLTGISIIPANAEDEGKVLYCQGMVCSETPPNPESFATFAVVDSTGTVENIIVCSIEHCPSTVESTYSTCPSCNLVQQTAPGITSGYRGTPENPVTYDAQAQVFTQDASTISETVDTVTLTATVDSRAIIFSPTVPITPVVKSPASATISATDGLVKEMAMFETPKTRAQLQANIQGKLALLERYLNRFYTLLNGWLID
jgi:hypothetical protein